jgi:catalase
MDAEKMALSSSANSQRKTDRKVRFSFVFTRSYATRNRTEVHGFAGRFAEGF